jgi:glycine cleavage system H protein
MNTKKDLKYSKTHEWLDIKGKKAKIGITDFAQDSLGDIVYVELPEIGQELQKDSEFGVVESVKAVSDLYSPLTGKVTDTNRDLEETPESLNSAPYDSWIIEVEIEDEEELDELMDEKDYIAFLEQEE